MFDFTVYLPGGNYLAVEAKVKGGKLSPEQSRVFGEFAGKTAHPVHIVWSLEEFRNLLDESK